MAIDWTTREDTEGLPAFIVAALARYEDGVATEMHALLEPRDHEEVVNAAEGYAEAARTELVSILDFLVGRLEAATD